VHVVKRFYEATKQEATTPQVVIPDHKDRDRDRQEVGAKMMQEDQKKDLITLSFLLNLLDGVLETPGRLLVITSNYPEKLDSALVRPGRIDVNIRFDYASCSMIREMLQHFYNLSDVEMSALDVPTSIGKRFSPAQVIEACCNFYTDYKKALEVLVSQV
jgi:ATP-dependent Zn protease